MNRIPQGFPETLPLKEEAKASLLAALEESPPVSARLHPRKKFQHVPLEEVKWCDDGVYLPQRPLFTFDPVFHSGGYYVQEASSMVVGTIVRQIAALHEIHTALDLCASPGGKSTHLLDALGDDAFLVSNEITGSRLGALMENLSKWGYPNHAVTSSDASAFGKAGPQFDLILVDAPCSGEGMFRKEDAAVTEWSLKNVQACAARQKNILSEIVPALKPGGFLVYSTCTYNNSENEDNVRFLMEECGMEAFSIGKPFEGIEQMSVNALRFFPHKVKGEGFFISVFKKTDDVPAVRQRKHVSKSEIVPDEMKRVLDDSGEGFFLFKHNDTIRFTTGIHHAWMDEMRKKIRLIRLGTAMGEVKGKDWIPDHELAMSIALDRTAFPTMELNYEDAIRFLSKENVSVTPENKGWGIFTYAGLPLGWYKSVPGRINNYFPKELKIRMKFDPEKRFSMNF